MLTFAVALALVGCAPPPYDTAQAGTEPSITITWPPPESSATGCVIVTVDVENFALNDPALAAGELVEGHGHYHMITPSGYDPCFAPYCLADFTGMKNDQQGELRALLVDNTHQAVLDPDGDPYEASILFNFVADPVCAGGEATPTDAGDTGGHHGS
jgi:hypothetical protein